MHPVFFHPHWVRPAKGKHCGWLLKGQKLAQRGLRPPLTVEPTGTWCLLSWGVSGCLLQICRGWDVPWRASWEWPNGVWHREQLLDGHGDDALHWNIDWSVDVAVHVYHLWCGRRRWLEVHLWGNDHCHGMHRGWSWCGRGMAFDVSLHGGGLLCKDLAAAFSLLLVVALCRHAEEIRCGI